MIVFDAGVIRVGVYGTVLLSLGGRLQLVLHVGNRRGGAHVSVYDEHTLKTMFEVVCNAV